jgi:hypothetical protein
VWFVTLMTSGERDVGCVMNGTGDGRVEGTGARLPEGDGTRRFVISIRVRLGSDRSSGPGLRGS